MLSSRQEVGNGGSQYFDDKTKIFSEGLSCEAPVKIYSPPNQDPSIVSSGTKADIAFLESNSWEFICARMPGWRVAPAVLLDSPVPKSNIAAEANNREGKGGLKQSGHATLIARKALENAGKASLQVLTTNEKYL